MEKNYNALNHIHSILKEPTMKYDSGVDFKKWQAEGKAKLTELLGLPFEMCDDMFCVTNTEKKDGYTQINFEFQSEEGYFVPCSMLVPDNMTKPLPVVICLQGHSTGMHISIGIPKFENDAKSIAGGRDFAVRAVKEGFCAIAFDQRHMGATGQNEVGRTACLSANTAASALLIGRTAIGERVWDASRLIDVIEKHLTEYIDTSKIILMGNSGGGTATFYTACLEERIYMAIPSCAVCTYDDSIMAMQHCSCNFIPGIRKYFNMGDLGGLIAPKKLIIVCGKNDRIFPLPGVKKSFEIIKSAYEANGLGDICHLVIGDEGHQFYPDETWPIAHSMMK
ncbi:MAG: hypothetical protein E7410_02800 [Ruminococcaceae bacterium]|nr:hypothetical protein [Oscillospiraceae bacterium]